MGPFKCYVPVSSFLLSIVLLLNSHLGLCCYTYIFSFGDSLIDTGNFVHNLGNAQSQLKELPYGMTYFKRPTGRICDGRVVLDFIAQAFNLPFVPPSLVGSAPADFPNGANFAYLGATALPPPYFKEKWNTSVPNGISLVDELKWFKDMLPLIAGGNDFTNVLSNSLILLGEIGGNDYNYWFFARHPRDQAYNLIPDVVGGISSTLQEIINLGSKTIVIPGNFPIGCVPLYLSDFQSQNKSDYDQLGCLTWYNDFSKRHNQALLDEINRLKPLHPDVKLIYADYFGASMQLFQNPGNFGIPNPLVACCGGNNTYHTSTCNSSATVWGDPAKFANWDGVHLTEEAYNVVATGVLQGPYADPPLSNTC